MSAHCPEGCAARPLGKNRYASAPRSRPSPRCRCSTACWSASGLLLRSSAPGWLPNSDIGTGVRSVHERSGQGCASDVRGPGLLFLKRTTLSPSGTLSRSRTLIVRYQRSRLPSSSSVNCAAAMTAAANSLRLVFSPAASACESSLSRCISTGIGQVTEDCFWGQFLTK
jgi:hypothetical protein